MPYAKTTALKKIAKLEKRYRMIAGGTSASKTISVLQLLIAMAQSDKEATLTSVVSESFPHLRRGAIRDFLNIMQEHKYFRDDRWSKTDFTYTFETGSKLEFFSADQPSKVRGPRRDRLFVNELNNVPQEAFEQMAVRTKEVIYADWNPVAEFYAYLEYIDRREDVDFLVLTYKDNEGLSQQIVDEIESRKNNKRWWRVYGEGLLGESEGRVFTGWNIIDEIPHEARLERRGLDFGYTNDPTAVLDVFYYNGGYILNEQIYRKGLSNKQIADLLNNLEQPNTIVMCDSAEPKSIDELRIYGVPALPVVKGRDSVLQGIQYVQDQRISVTKRSVNLLKEYRNYLWKEDKDGKIINTPEDIYNHLMDATRYAFESLRPKDYDDEGVLETTGEIETLIY
jgi:phage terminase large subunit